MKNKFEPIGEIRDIRCSCGIRLTLSKDQLLDLLEFDTIRPTCIECNRGLKISRIRGGYFIRDN